MVSGKRKLRMTTLYYKKKWYQLHLHNYPKYITESNQLRNNNIPSILGHVKLRQGRPVLADGEPTDSAPVKSPPSTNTSVLSTSGVESNKKKGSARGPYANYDTDIMKQMIDAGVKSLLFGGGTNSKHVQTRQWYQQRYRFHEQRYCAVTIKQKRK